MNFKKDKRKLDTLASWIIIVSLGIHFTLGWINLFFAEWICLVPLSINLSGENIKTLKR